MLKTNDYKYDREHYTDELTIIIAINGRLRYIKYHNQFLKHLGKVHAQAFFTQNGSNNVIMNVNLASILKMI